MRVTVGAVILWVQEIHRAARGVAAFPDAMRTAPWGLGWLAHAVPISEPLADAAYVVLMIAAATGAVGLWSRASFAIVTAVGLWFWMLPEMAGAVFHYHHLLWLSALLAVSPCGDALSIDRWRAARRGVPPPVERHLLYGAPLRIAWILIGFVYFFPGAWKVASSGWAWIWSDNLRDHLWAKWAQMPSYRPLLRIDRYPVLLRLGALFVVALELSFGVLVLFRRTRLVAIAAAFAFHQMTAWFMGLRFPALWLCFTIFVDWTPIAAWLRARLRRPAPITGGPRAPPPRGAPAIAVAGAVLIAGAASFGIAGESEGWPFACYPKFDQRAPSSLPYLEVELVSAAAARTVPDEWLFPRGRTQRTWAFVWSLVGVRGNALSPARLAAFWSTVGARDRIRDAARDATAVRFYRVQLSTRPEDRARPIARWLIYEMPLRGAS